MPIRKEIMFFNKEITIELSSDFDLKEYYRLLDENSNNLVDEAMNYLVESSSNDSSNKVICNFWDKLVDFAIVYLKETDTFYEIKVTTSETNILKKGFTITYLDNGKILKSKEDVHGDSIIKTKVADGIIESIVKEKK